MPVLGSSRWHVSGFSEFSFDIDELETKVQTGHFFDGYLVKICMSVCVCTEGGTRKLKCTDIFCFKFEKREKVTVLL